MRVTVVLSLLAIGVTTPAIAADFAATDLTVSAPEFCSVVQRRLEGTTMVSANVNHPDYEAFQQSKAEVQPLRTEQFIEYRDPTAKADPMRISCKVKTADHLNEVFGAGTAKESGSCEMIHREMAAAVAASLAPGAAKIAVTDIVFDADDIKYMGSQWVSPYQYVYRDAAGKIHLKSKALLVNWTDIRFKLAPDRFRGAHYCHLIAPEYLAKLMTGAATAPLME